MRKRSTPSPYEAVWYNWRTNTLFIAPVIGLLAGKYYVQPIWRESGPIKYIWHDLMSSEQIGFL